MHFSKPTTTTLLLSLLPLMQLTTATTGNATVLNKCSFPLYLWSVGGSVGPSTLIQPNDQYTEPLHYDPASGGVALKITTSAGGLFNGSPQTNFAYTLDGQGVWYDLSDVFGDAFAGEALAVVASKEDCPGICWPEGVDPNGASETKVCQASADVTLTVCAGSC